MKTIDAEFVPGAQETETVKVTISGIKVTLETERVPEPQVVVSTVQLPPGFNDGTRRTLKIEGEIVIETVSERPRLTDPLAQFRAFGDQLRDVGDFTTVSGYDPTAPMSTPPPAPTPKEQ